MTSVGEWRIGVQCAILESMERLQVLCFAGTYALALVCDLARMVYRGPARWWAFVGLSALGLTVHTIYLGYHAASEDRWSVQTVFDSLLLVAWMLAAVNLYLTLRVSRQAVVGLFFLPMILILCGLAARAPRANWADWGGWTAFWGTVHGLFWLGGTAAAGMAFAAALMYLVQETRLKRKQPVPFGFTLLSLEQSERLNRAAIIVAFPLLTCGLTIGLVLAWALRRASEYPLGWSDPKVISGLAMWVAYAWLAHASYRWAMRGRRIMHLSIAAFAVLIFALVGVDLLLPTAHGVPAP